MDKLIQLFRELETELQTKLNVFESEMARFEQLQNDKQELEYLYENLERRFLSYIIDTAKPTIKVAEKGLQQNTSALSDILGPNLDEALETLGLDEDQRHRVLFCLLYTSDAADE